MKTVTAKNKYGMYYIPFKSKHRASSKKLLNGQVWEPETINFIKKYCTHELVHAGAYFGDMLPAFSTIKKVWAFEACRENYQAALMTIKSNNLTNINLKNVALGEKSKTSATLMTERDGKTLGGGSKIIDRPKTVNQELGRMGKTYKTTEVPMITIDEAIPQDSEISIIHLDVELYELLVLHGAVKTIKRCSPYLILETHRTNKELSKFLNDLGYKLYTKEKMHRENTCWKRIIE